MSKRRILEHCVLALTLAAAAGCVTKEQKSRAAIDRFKQTTAGEFQSDTGSLLFIAPVRARMVTDEAIYVERTDAGVSQGWLIDIALGADGKKIIQRALVFTQEGQWRNLRENPELFTALLPKDVRPAGTCDIKPAEDANSVTYSCGGARPELFLRRR